MPLFTEVFRPGFIDTFKDYEWNPDKVIFNNFVQRGYPLEFERSKKLRQLSDRIFIDVFCHNPADESNLKLRSRLDTVRSLPDYLFLKYIGEGYNYAEYAEKVLNEPQRAGELLGITWKQFIYLTENDFRYGLVRSLIRFGENLKWKSQKCLAGEWIYQDWDESGRIKHAKELEARSNEIRSKAEKTGTEPLPLSRMEETIKALMSRVDALFTHQP